MAPRLHDPVRPPCRRAARGGGFTYLGLLILLAVMGVASAATLQMGSVLQRRAAEEELLGIGAEFRNALASYAAATPAGRPRAPRTLQELLKDPRFPGVRRHLRKLYADPITGKQEWGVVQAMNGGGIVGVYSLSRARPIKIGNFDLAFQGFGKRTSYREWVFSIPLQPGEAPVRAAPEVIQ
jgi:type II secretory pathway pseudopilin PulG